MGKKTKKTIKKKYRSIVGSKLEDNLHVLKNGRRPKFLGKWKITLIFWQWEEDLHFWQREYNLNVLANGRAPQYFGNWKKTFSL